MHRQIRSNHIKNGSKWLRQDKRLAIMIRDGFKCAYCDATVENGASLTLDHITPTCYSTVPNNSQRNLVVACADCNSSRGNQLLAVWLKRVDPEYWTERLVTVNFLRMQPITEQREVAKALLMVRSIAVMTGNARRNRRQK